MDSISTFSTTATTPRNNLLLAADDTQYLRKERRLDLDWIYTNCKSVDVSEASLALGYPAQSGGILFLSAEYGQWQLRPYTPWPSRNAKPGDEPPKYRTPRGEYDIYLPQHPTDKTYWSDIDALRQRAIQINGKYYLLLTEGDIKAITGCMHGIPTVAVAGVDMGLTPKAKGKPDLVPILKRFVVEYGFHIIIAYDADFNEKPGVRGAQKRLTKVLHSYGCDVLSISGHWKPEEGKGMDDFINNEARGIEAFRAILMKATPIGETLHTGDKKGKQLPPPSKVAAELGEIYREKLAWESEYQLWRQYGGKFDGAWSIATTETVRGLIHTYLRSQDLHFNAGFVSSIEKILQSDLEVLEWNEQTGLIPLRDGVLDQKTKELKPHKPGYRFTWQLPHRWADSHIGCQPIEDFLFKVTGCQAIANVLLAFLSAVVTRRADLQRYLELIGGGGTGKSTVMGLARALAGYENTASSQLSHLESNQFETAKFYGKSLAIFPDSERWQGEVGNLKRLTGQDPIRYERKGIQQSKDYIFGGMVILSANEPIESKDKTSGLKRRQLTIPFDIRVPEYKGRNLIKEFEPYIPGLLKRVLDISPEEVTRLIGDTDEQVPELAGKKWEQMYQTNDIARWLDDKVVLDTELMTYVGTNDETKTSSWLYASYCVDRQEQNEKPISMKAFRPNLMDLLLNQLKVPVVSGEDRKGRFIKGLGLRCFHDPTGEIYPRPVTKKPFGGGGLMVVGGGCVVAESIASGGWDGCDGLIENSKNTENYQPTTAPTSNQNQNGNGDGENNPQHPPNPPLAGTPATTQLPQDKKNPPQCRETHANRRHANQWADRMREILANGSFAEAKELLEEIENLPPSQRVQQRGFFWQNLEETNEKHKARLLMFAGLREGEKLKYVGSVDQYQGLELTAHDADGCGGITCLLPDGRGFTTWISSKELKRPL